MSNYIKQKEHIFLAIVATLLVVTSLFGSRVLFAQSEDNDSCDNPYPLYIDYAPVIHDLEAEGDVDFFIFDAIEGSIYQIDGEAIGADTDMSIELQFASDCDGTDTSSNNDFNRRRSTAPGVRIQFESPVTGQIILRVGQANDVYGSDTDYSIQVSLLAEAENDEYEPDDTCIQANTLLLDVPRTHQLTSDDQDWFVFAVQSGKRYRLDVQEEGVDTAVELMASCSSGSFQANTTRSRTTQSKNDIESTPAPSFQPVINTGISIPFTAHINGNYYLRVLPQNVLSEGAGTITVHLTLVDDETTLPDTDGDGLPDKIEIEGYDINNDGIVDIDLPAMGADPMHKDIFVEIDYMVNPADTSFPSYQPTAASIAAIVDSFNNAPVDNPDGTTGIHLHVDYGAAAPLTWGNASTWGSLSKGNSLPYTEYIGGCNPQFNWTTQFDIIKQTNFTAGREPIFHYNIWGDHLCPIYPTVAGLSRNSSTSSTAYHEGASDFVVMLGALRDFQTSDDPAGLFMQQLGHNLGLMHGGGDHDNYKPNYLSVMNYLYTLSGLHRSGTWGHYDYSRYTLGVLDENNLDETTGLTELIGSQLNFYEEQVYHYCPGTQIINTGIDQIDWNCDGDTLDTNLSHDVNGDGILELLTTQNDWDNLSYTGGFIGTFDGLIGGVNHQQAEMAAIIVGGQIDNYNRLIDNLYSATDGAYEMFQRIGYDPDDIYYLAPDLVHDGVDTSSTRAHLEYAITEWAKQKQVETLTLYMVVLDCEEGVIYLDGANGEIVTAAELDSWLDELEAANSGIEINVIYDSSFSGGFITDEPSLSAPNRLIITSSGARYLAYASQTGTAFSDPFIQALNTGNNLSVAYQEADAIVQDVRYGFQQPNIDANGNGIPNESEDYAIAQTRSIIITPPSDPHEPADNTCNGAVTLQLGDPAQWRNMNNSIGSNDVDWFKVELSAGYDYLVSLRNIGADADPQSTVYDSCDPNNAGTVLPITGASSQFNVVADGWFYIEVAHTSANYGTDNTYTIAIEEIAAAPIDLETDTDGDGLPDAIEINGYDVDGDGIPEVDLPAMGADPLHKDIFIEIDYMDGADGTFYTYQPARATIDLIIAAFDDADVENPSGETGIHLHVDYGADSPLTWGGGDDAKWGSLSRATMLPHQKMIGQCSPKFKWDNFDEIKFTEFDNARLHIFHYNIWAHQQCNTKPNLGGLSRNHDDSFGLGASDFLVFPGAWLENGHSLNTTHLAGVFMHELGHNLGLQHGGADHDNHKPNYLSIMNYLFTEEGLNKNGIWGHYDYSRYENPPLDESNLDESVGLNYSDWTVSETKFRLSRSENGRMSAYESDWNRDGQIEAGVQRDLNGDGKFTVMHAQNDWNNLVYDGGLIGQFFDAADNVNGYNIEITLPNETSPDEIEIIPANPSPVPLNIVVHHLQSHGLAGRNVSLFIVSYLCVVLMGTMMAYRNES